MENSDKTKNGKNVEDGIDADTFKVTGWGTRHTQCLVMFVSFLGAYSMRTFMGVALVAMTHKDIVVPITPDNFTAVNNGTDFTNTSRIDMNETEHIELHGILNKMLLTPPYPKFDWNKKTQDTILASFFWGYMSLQIPSGQLAHRFGARILLFGALLINGIVSIIMPLAMYYGNWPSALVCRLTQGMAQACIIPSMHTILGKWAPLEERGRMTGAIYGGQAIGTVLGMLLTGFIASSVLGWPGIFRFYGVISVTLSTIVWFTLADTPAQHKSISMAERRYIEVAMGQREGVKHFPVPWKKIFQHRGMMAIIVAHIGSTWGQLTLFSELPSFMDKVMGLNLRANGLLTALPFLMMWFTNSFFSWFTDMLITRKYTSVTNARKLANSLGSIPPSIGLIVLAFVPKNLYVVETILVVICSFKIASGVGFHVNHVDIAPNFAGTMISISNFAANAVASLSPIVAGVILTDPTDERLWRQIFFIAAGMYFCSNLVYLFFGTGELAEWNDPEYEKVALEDNLHNKVKKVTIDEENGNR